jgi:hypothetical protein
MNSLTEKYQVDNITIEGNHNLGALLNPARFLGNVLRFAKNYRILHLFVALIILSSLFMGIPGQKAAAAVTGHPRLYFTAAELTALQALRTSPSHQANWNAIKDWADEHINDSAPTQSGLPVGWANKVIKQYLENMGFVYAMTGTTSYANAAKRWALAVAGWTDWEGSGNDLTASIMSAGMSFAYDVLYGYLTDAEKNTIRTAIINKMGPYYQAYLQNGIPYENAQNGNAFLAGGMGLAGLALEGDYAGAGNWISYAKVLSQEVLDHAGADGGWYEGLNYAVSLRYVVSFFDALKRVEGDNLFDNDFLRQLPYYFIYGTHNTTVNGESTKTFLPFEDTEFTSVSVFRDPLFVYRLASEYNDGYAQWFADQSAASVRDALANSAYGEQGIGMYIWKNPGVVARPPADLPLVRYFPDSGYVIVRTDWTFNDYVFWFKSGSSQGHAQPNQNAWSLCGPSDMVSGEPGYVTPLEWNQTRTHNAILGDGLGQAQEGDYMPTGVRGVVQQVDVNPAYVYMRGDAHATYTNYHHSNPLLSSGDLNKWLRSVVVMQNPFYFVIFDDVAAPRAEQLDWLFQGNGGSFTTNSNVITLNHGTSLKAVILEPGSFATQLVTDTSITRYPQMRVRPATNTSQANFLTALFPGSTLQSTEVKQSNLIGVIVNTDTTHIDLHLFSKDGNPVDQYIELGNYYQSADGNAYTFDGTRVRAQYTNYEVMRLAVAAGGNQAPVLGSISNKTIGEGQALSFTISATDPDGGTLTYSAAGLPSGATFNAVTRTFSWTPTPTQAGTYPNVQFEVSDGSLTDSEDITITVHKVDQPPKSNLILTITLVVAGVFLFSTVLLNKRLRRRSKS